MHRVDRLIEPGGTLLEIVTAAVGGRLYAYSDAHVFIGDHLIPRENWARVRPKSGHLITIRVVPMGGEGGQKSPLRTVLTIAVLAAALATGVGVSGLFAAGSVSGAVAGGLAAAAVTLVGSALVNAIAPPPEPRSDGTDLNALVPSVTGIRNQANPYGPFPRPYGRHRLFPTIGAKQFTELVGDDQYLRALFAWQGPNQVDDMRIGATPIGQFEDVETVVRQGFDSDPPLTLFNNAPNEDAFSIKLTQADGFQTRRTQQDVDEISVDIAFPAGVIRRTESGKKREWVVEVEAEFRPASGGAWTALKDWRVAEKTTKAIRLGVRRAVARDTYDVRLRRITDDIPEGSDAKSRIFDEVFWTALRTFRHISPLNAPNLTTVEVRIRATDQLNGLLDSFNCISTSILPVWTGAAWVEQPTRLAAWAFADGITGVAAGNLADKSRLDADTLKDWADENQAAGRFFDAVIDTRTTILQFVRDAAAAGRASLAIRDGRYSVARDVPQSVPVGLITPRNSWGARGSVVYIDMPHALRVRFINPDRDWQQDEVIVYDDGFDASNASKFEVLELFGITDANEAWRRGRFQLAERRLRPETYTRFMDFEHLIYQRGDPVRLVDDVPLFGLGYARIKSVQADGSSNATGITLDDAVTMEGGKAYTVRIRLATGAQLLEPVDTVAGEQTALTFTTAIPNGQPQPAAGDLTAFGEVGQESIEAVVSRIRRAEEHTAEITLMDAAPAIHLADQGPIPPHDSQISLPPEPGKPIITGVRADEAALIRMADGSLEPRVIVSFTIPAGSGLPVRQVQARWRDTGAQIWNRLPPVDPEAGEVIVAGVEEGDSIDVNLRGVASDAAVSSWTAENGIVVVGQASVPIDVTGFSVNVVGASAFLSWDEVAVADLSHYRVRYSPLTVGASWAGATDLVPMVSASATAIEAPARVGTYLIKAVDRSGRESDVAAAIATTLAAVSGLNVVEMVTEHPGFAGATAGTAVVDQSVKLDTLTLFDDGAGQFDDGVGLFDGGGLPGLIAAEGTYTFDRTVDLGAVYTSRVTARMTVTAEDHAALFDDTPGDFDDRDGLFDGELPGQVNVGLQICTTEDDPAGAPVWTGWRDFVVGDYTARAMKFRIVLSTANPSATPVVKELSVEIDMPDRVVADTRTAPAAGETVPFAPDFRVLQGIGVTPKDMAQGDYWAVTAEGPSGFTIRFFDSLGAGVQRDYSYVAKGYGEAA